MSNNDMEDIIKIVKSLEDSGLLIKRVRETIQNETKEQKLEFLIFFIKYISSYFIRKYVSR